MNPETDGDALAFRPEGHRTRRPRMINHVSLGTNDVARSRAFYDPLMELLGLRCLKVTERMVGYGTVEILFSLEVPVEGGPATAGNGVHVAFLGRDRSTVDSFHGLALQHGGTDAGEPGRRPQYDANYYAAYVRDPEGNKIEAVTFSAK
jgi:catechol 2,3-dioxygenase-like lactoylglutathione lyase family enzyme